MSKLKSGIIINIEIPDLQVISDLNNICTELSITPDVFISKSIEHMLYDIQFVRSLRGYSKSDKEIISCQDENT
jgi:hypothetical protein